MAVIKPYPHYEINVEDLSIYEPVETEWLPLHRPNYLIRARKGPVGVPVWCNTTAERDRVFGSETFDVLNKKYFGMEALFLNQTMQNCGAFITRLADKNALQAICLLQCTVIPAGSSFGNSGMELLWTIRRTKTYDDIKALKTEMLKPNSDDDCRTHFAYLKNASYGSTKITIEDESYDISSIIDVQVDGAAVYWFNAATSKWTLLTESSMKKIPSFAYNTNVQDVITYPMMMFVANNPGEWGNDVGWQLYFDSELNTSSLVGRLGAVEYTLAPIQKYYNENTTDPIYDIYNNTSNSFVMKPNVIDPSTEQNVSIEDVLNTAYAGAKALPYAIYSYEDNWEYVGTECAKAESDPRYVYPKDQNDYNTYMGSVEGWDDDSSDLGTVASVKVDGFASLENTAYIGRYYAADQSMVTFNSFSELLEKGFGTKINIYTDANGNPSLAAVVKNEATESTPVEYYTQSLDYTKLIFYVKDASDDVVNGALGENWYTYSYSEKTFVPYELWQEFDYNYDKLDEQGNPTPVVVYNPWNVNIISCEIPDGSGKLYTNLSLASAETIAAMSPSKNIGMTVNLVEGVTNFLTNGNDGVIDSDASHEINMRSWLRLSTYPDAIDKARYPFTHFFDVGYSLPTKKELLKFLTTRDDVKVVLSTQTVTRVQVGADGSLEDISSKDGIVANTQMQDESIGSVLRASALAERESVLKGTSCCRATIMTQCGKLVGGTYKGLVPLTYWLASKKAEYQNLDYLDREPKGLPYAQQELINDLNWVPSDEDSKSRSWDNGLNYCQYYSRTQLHYASLRSVYKYDTSVLVDDGFTDFIVYIKHEVRQSWATFTGRSDKFGILQLLIKNDLDDRLWRVANNKYTVNNKVYETSEDVKLGYSLHVDIEVISPSTKRVWIVTVQCKREGYEG